KMKRKRYRRFQAFLCAVALVAAIFAVTPVGFAAATVTLSPSLTSGAPVGSHITWTASSSALDATHYRFIIQRLGGPKRIVRDFDIYSSFEWTPLEEGVYYIRVVVRGANGKLQDAG